VNALIRPDRHAARACLVRRSQVFSVLREPSHSTVCFELPFKEHLPHHHQTEHSECLPSPGFCLFPGHYCALALIYRWSGIEKLDEDLLFFTHVLDNHRRVIGFLDHVILADPDLTRQKGWSANESLRYRLPEGVHEVHLRLGLFRKSSGERVPIQEASADALTLSHTDQWTAGVGFSGVWRQRQGSRYRQIG